MSFKNLVDDQCGATNSLVQLSTHFVQDRALSDQGLLHPFQHETHSDQPEQFSDSTQSFRMDSLLSEMRDLENAAHVKNVPPPQNSYPPPPIKENVSDWANQYIESGNKFSYVEEKPYKESIWSTGTENAQDGDQFAKTWINSEFDFNANWAQDYFKDAPPAPPVQDILANTQLYFPPPEITELQLAAGQVADSMSDTQFSNSRFLKFMNQVSEGQTQINNGRVTGESDVKEAFAFDKWATLADSPASKTDEKSFTQWGTPVGNEKQSDAEVKDRNAVNEDTYSKELWSKLTERWEQLNLTNHDPWDSEFNKFVASLDTYNFAEENPMADKLNALEEGKKKLAAGDLPSAVLCFEAAVQQSPESVEGWQLLGRTQAENEQDQQAIAALKKCIKLDAGNLEALKEIAVCYTNENYQFQACSALKEWLIRNPKYSDLVERTAEEENQNEVTSILTMKYFNEVLNLYLQAVQRYPNAEEADADVQNGLGVLLTLNTDYDKAIDCFETAVKIRPDDSRLWNRLGATLANGQKPEQALEAYRKALTISPGFIRARYNLGITCVHLRMYKQAIEYLLIALNQQVAGRGIHGEKSQEMSESIWTTLRLALSLSNRKEMLPVAEKRDLNTLNAEFNISLQEIPEATSI